MKKNKSLSDGPEVARMALPSGINRLFLLLALACYWAMHFQGWSLEAQETNRDAVAPLMEQVQSGGDDGINAQKKLIDMGVSILPAVFRIVQQDMNDPFRDVGKYSPILKAFGMASIPILGKLLVSYDADCGLDSCFINFGEPALKWVSEDLETETGKPLRRCVNLIAGFGEKAKGVLEWIQRLKVQGDDHLELEIALALPKISNDDELLFKNGSKLMTHGDYWICERCVIEVSRISSKKLEAVDLLIPMLNDRSIGLRQIVARALAHIGSPALKAVPLMKKEKFNNPIDAVNFDFEFDRIIEIIQSGADESGKKLKEVKSEANPTVVPHQASPNRTPLAGEDQTP